MSSAPIKTASYQDVKNLHGNVLLIDVREPAELQQTGVLPKSINIPLGKIEETFKTLSNEDFRQQYGCDKPDTSKAMIFSCKAGIRSAKAMKIIANLGYQNTSNYEGGYDDWEQQTKQSAVKQ